MFFYSSCICSHLAFFFYCILFIIFLILSGVFRASAELGVDGIGVMTVKTVTNTVGRTDPHQRACTLYACTHFSLSVLGLGDS